MKEIILIQPKAGTLDLLGARLPLGLLSIAAAPFQKGYHITIIDQRVDMHWQQTLRSALEKDPICVGITCMTGKQILHALEAAKIVREKCDTPLVWGGVHTTIMPDQSLENPYVDIVVIREGDLIFIELVEALEQNMPLDGIKGIYYKQNGKVVKNPERDFIKNLDELPDLPYDLVDVSAYSSMDVEGRSADFVTSRGCAFKCSFCYNIYFNKRKWRAFSAKDTVRRLKDFVEKYQIKTIYFQDDNFFSNRKRSKEILQLIVDEKLDIKWGTLGLRVDTAMKFDDEMYELLVASGCMNVDIGAESGNERILELIDKNITVEDMFKVANKISKYPFILKYTFIIGFPTETREELRTTIRTALKLTEENKNIYTPILAYTPYPGSPMYDFAVKHGFVPPVSLEEWGYFGIDNWYYNFKSWLSSKQMREIKSIEFTSLFSNKKIKYKINKFTTKILFNLYHPIAKFRFRNHFHSFPIDSMLFKKYFGHTL